MKRKIINDKGEARGEGEMNVKLETQTETQL